MMGLLCNLVSIVSLVSLVSLAVLYYQNTRAEQCKLMTHDSKKVVTSERGQKVKKDGHFFRRYLLTFVFFLRAEILCLDCM